MFFQVSFLATLVITDLAFKRAFSRMSTQMFFKVPQQMWRVIAKATKMHSSSPLSGWVYYN